MAEPFLGLSAKDRADALAVAASHTGRPVHILEKDVWVVWTLATLFEAPLGGHLVFKGGTSLSKAYGAIRRFSEDIDVTYDIRALLPDLTRDAGPEVLPPSGSQRKKWSSAIRERLPQWTTDTALPLVQKRLSDERLAAKVHADGDCLYIEYEPATSGYGYVAPRIKIEFGARSTGEPIEVKRITCDADGALPQLLFPVASPRVMRVERTFWEKATAIHVFSQQTGIRDRLARHWYDVARLDAAGLATRALTDRALARAVADHKQMFFAERDLNNNPIDYHAAVSGGLILVPEGSVLASLRSDYLSMIEDGLFLEMPESFEQIVEHCRDIQARANVVVTT